MNEVVKKYFDAQAHTYQHTWNKWPGSQIRQSESSAVMSLYNSNEIANKTIVEFGSGSGYYTRLLLTANPKRIYAIDFSQAMLDNLPSAPAGTIIPVHGDATTVTLETKFSFLLSAGLLEFVPSPALAIANMAKHALPEATLIVLMPLNNWLGKLYRLFHQSHGVNITLFSLAQFKQLVGSHWQVVAFKKCGLFSVAARLKLK